MESSGSVHNAAVAPESAPASPAARTGGRQVDVAPLPGGEHWKSPAMVPPEIPNMEREHAERASELRVLRRMLPLPPDRTSRILDLGSGPGTIAAAVLKAYPLAQAVCVDFAEGRVAVGERYMAPFGDRVRFAAGDLNDLRWEGPLAGTFDAVVTAYAIHHVSDARKQALYREIFDHLAPGGALMHFECVRSANVPLEGLYWAAEGSTAWRRRNSSTARSPAPIPPRPPERSVSTVEEHLGWLRETGFVSVDCYWRTFALALFGGYRPLGPM